MRRRVPNRGRIERQADDLLKNYKKEVSRAEDIYQLFYAREPDADIFLDVEWPVDQVLLGKATAIGYRSDKWHKGKFIDYIHRHEKPYPRVLLERPEDDFGSDILRDVMQQRRANPIIKPPDAYVFAQLGHCLDVEFIRDGIVQQLDYKMDTLPILAADLKRNVLVIIPADGGFPVLLTSPIMKITSGGIES